MSFFKTLVFCIIVWIPLFSKVQIRQAGSSTIYPFALKVAAEFSKNANHIVPFLESTGSTKGFSLLSVNGGALDYDIIGSSRKIRLDELDRIKKAGINLSEICIGLDGVVAITRKNQSLFKNLRLKDINLALKEKIKNKQNQIMDNPYKTWHEINADLPNIPIRILISPKNHATRDMFELILSDEIRKAPEVRELDKSEMDESHELLFDFLEKNDNYIAFVGINRLNHHNENFEAIPIDSIEPTFANIQSEKYPLTRKLYLYVKTYNYKTTEGLREYLAEWQSSRAIGEEGYLTKMGLIPITSNNQD